VAVSGLESTLADIMACVDRKGVKKSENLLALPASAGEEALEREGRMDLCVDQRLAEVLDAVVRRRRVAAVREVVVVEESAVRRWRIGWARELAALWGVATKEWADCQ
jgi:hypothetical protein